MSYGRPKKLRGWRAKAEKRFRELVALHALSRSTPREDALLERYQILRRSFLGGDSIPPDLVRKEWESKMLLKQVRGILRARNAAAQTEHAELVANG